MSPLIGKVVRKLKGQDDLKGPGPLEHGRIVSVDYDSGQHVHEYKLLVVDPDGRLWKWNADSVKVVDQNLRGGITVADLSKALGALSQEEYEVLRHDIVSMVAYKREAETESYATEAVALILEKVVDLLNNRGPYC